MLNYRFTYLPLPTRYLQVLGFVISSIVANRNLQLCIEIPTPDYEFTYYDYDSGILNYNRRVFTRLAAKVLRVNVVKNLRSQKVYRIMHDITSMSSATLQASPLNWTLFTFEGRHGDAADQNYFHGTIFDSRFEQLCNSKPLTTAYLCRHQVFAKLLSLSLFLIFCFTPNTRSHTQTTLIYLFLSPSSKQASHSHSTARQTHYVKDAGMSSSNFCATSWRVPKRRQIFWCVKTDYVSV